MKQSTRRLASFAVALVLFFGAIVLFSGFVRPAYTEAQKVKGELLGKENLLQNQRSAIEQVKSLVAAYEGEGNFAEVVALALPQNKNESEAIYHIGKIAELNQLAVQSIAVNAPGIQNVTAAARGGSGLTKPVGSLNIQVRLSGTYAHFEAFLENLETNIRVMDIKNLSITPAGRSNQDFYLFDITVATYYQSP